MRCLIIIAYILPFLTLGQGGIGYLYETTPELLFDCGTGNQRTIKTHNGVLPLIRQSTMGEKVLSRDSSFVSVTGIGEAGFRYLNTSQYRAGGGLLLESAIKDKWAFRVGVLSGYSLSDSVWFPRAYFTKSSGDGQVYADVRASASFTPNDIFNFQLGMDHNFIGEGCRSLFLSDYGKAYPFGQIRARFWRVEYTVLYQFFREMRNENWFLKNGATHHISFNAAKWLNIGIFETVVFQPKDTLLNRGFEPEYLNPVIFYRPQEYALGSADNVLLGASFSAHYKAHTLYGQLILDEFSLTEIKAKSGWWANKYGMQLGVKGFTRIRKDKAFYRIEYNSVRPYTYAHLSPGQNYGNMGMTLAHPYGANFMELLGEFKINRGRWNAKLFVSYFLRGYDKDGYSYGMNVYQPYIFRPYEYGHFTGQGRGNNGFRTILTVSYKLLKQGNLTAFIEQQYRYDSAFGTSGYVPMIGIRSELWNDYRNY